MLISNPLKKQKKTKKHPKEMAFKNVTAIFDNFLEVFLQLF